MKLLEHGHSVLILEKSKSIGGLAKTEVQGNYRLDIGPHFITSQNNDVLHEILDLFDPEELITFSRHAKMLFDDRYLDYPLTAKNVFTQMGLRHALLGSVSYLSTVVRKIIFPNERLLTFEDWAKRNFGNYLYKIFFRPYTEQFWGIKCDKLSVDCIPLVTKMSFLKTLRMLVIDKFQNDSLSLAERETTLPLYYPLKGFGELAIKLAEKFHHLGGKIQLETDVLTLDYGSKDGFEVKFRNGNNESTKTVTNIISTIPIAALVEILRPPAPQELRYKSTQLGYLSVIVVYLIIADRDLFDCSYLYILGKPYNRISNTRRFCPELCPQSENMIALEITCQYDDRMWRKDDKALADICVQQLELDDFLEKGEVKESFVVRKRFAYPFYTTEYKRNLEDVMSHLNAIENLATIGRTGAFKYMDSDQCVEDASSLAKQLNG